MKNSLLTKGASDKTFSGKTWPHIRGFYTWDSAHPSSKKTSYRLQPTAYSLMPTAYRLPPTAYRLPPTAYRLPLNISYILLTAILLFSSCVSNKKITYLQDLETNEKRYPRDSIIKAYDDQYRQYQLKENDIISLRIGSLTPAEYNFVKEYEEQLGIIRRLSQYDQGQQDGGGISQRFNQGIRQGQDGGGISGLYLDRMNTGFILDEFGQLELPQVGFVELKGLTLDEAEKKIQNLLIEGKLFETPIVRIQLMSFQFTVLGEVENEGRYTTYDPRTEIFDAFVMADNLTEFADRANVKIIRRIGGESHVIYVNTLDQRFLAAENIYLYPDDMIIVPPLNARFWRQYVIPDARTALGIVSAAVSLFLLVETLRNR